jgi:hypothetical protein
MQEIIKENEPVDMSARRALKIEDIEAAEVKAVEQAHEIAKLAARMDALEARFAGFRE